VIVKKLLLPLSLIAVVASIVAVETLACCRKPVDTRGWKLTQFVDHLRVEGFTARVVSSRGDGGEADNLYLTEDAGATWSAFQLKNRNVEHAAQWRGSVWVGRIDAAEEVEWELAQWGEHGYRIDRFLVFGDARLVERIRRAFNR
jgi:hypothetical protein